MKILFSRRHNIGSLLIRLSTWSHWSHVDIILDDDYIISASAPYGVKISKLEDRLSKSSAAYVVEFPLDNEKDAINWAKSQIGLHYDWLGVIGLGIKRDLEQSNAWYCSEYVTSALKHGGLELFRKYAMRRINPEHLWMLNYPCTKVK